MRSCKLSIELSVFWIACNVGSLLGVEPAVFAVSSNSKETVCTVNTDCSPVSSESCQNYDLMTERRSTVAIVGGGIAGLTSALTALHGGAKVVLIEKQRLGGNSIKATSGINAINTYIQRNHVEGRCDTIDAFVRDIIVSGQDFSDVKLARRLAASSHRSIDFLESLGLKFSSVERLGGHSYPRTHVIQIDSGAATPKPVGVQIVSALKSALSQYSSNDLEVLENTEVKDIKLSEYVDGGWAEKYKVTQIVYESYDTTSNDKSKERQCIPVDAIILAAGGYSADRSSNGVIAEHAPNLLQFGTTNGNFATGDMIRIGKNLGFDFVGLEDVQLHPTAFVDMKQPFAFHKFLCPELFRGLGSLLLDIDGKRFVNELSTRQTVSEFILEKGISSSHLRTKILNLSPVNEENHDDFQTAVLILNDDIVARIGPSVVNFYKSRNLIIRTGSLTDTCNFMQWDKSVFEQMLSDYAESAVNNETDLHGKSFYPTVFSNTDQFSIAFVTPATHYTMGGIKVNASGQVCLRSSTDCLKIIPNLFAIGEVTGGLHGKNRLGGNGLLESVVDGLKVGDRASKIYNSDWNEATWNIVTISEIEDSHFGFQRLRLELPSVFSRFSNPLGQAALIFVSSFVNNYIEGSVAPKYIFTDQSADGHFDVFIPNQSSNLLEPGLNVHLRIVGDEDPAHKMILNEVNFIREKQLGMSPTGESKLFEGNMTLPIRLIYCSEMATSSLMETLRALNIIINHSQDPAKNQTSVQVHFTFNSSSRLSSTVDEKISCHSLKLENEFLNLLFNIDASMTCSFSDRIRFVFHASANDFTAQKLSSFDPLLSLYDFKFGCDGA